MGRGEPAVSWSHTSEDAPILGALVLLPYGIVGGMGLFAVGGTLWLLASSVLRGAYATAFGIGFVLVFALGVSAAYLEPVFGADRRRAIGFDPDFGPRRFAVASVVGLGVLLAAFSVGGFGFFAILLGSMVVPPLAVGALTSEGELDADARTLTYCGTDVELAALDGVRRWSIGGYVVYRLSYVAGGAGFATPRTVVVPRSVDSAIRAAFQEGVAAEREVPSSSSRLVPVAAVGLGICFFGFAGFLLTVEPTSTHPRGAGVLWYGTLVIGLFGVLFVGVGLRTA